MAVGGTSSITEQLERRGLEVGQREFTQHQQQMMHQPSGLTRATRMVQNSVRARPGTWALVSLGVGCLIGATWFLSSRDWR